MVGAAAAPALPADPLVHERWQKLQRLLSQRYANPAEAFVAFGGRMGYEIRAGDFERALRDVAARERSLRGSGAVDIHGLMSDFEGNFPSGMLWEQFVAALKWDQDESAAAAAKPKKTIIVPNFPSSTFRAAQSTQLGAARASGTLMQGGAVSALRQSRDRGNKPADALAPGQAQFVGLEGAAPQQLGPTWSKGQGPPPNWMVRQRQLAAQQGGATPLAGGTQLASRAPRAKQLERKLRFLEQEDRKLQALVAQRPPPGAAAPPAAAPAAATPAAPPVEDAAPPQHEEPRAKAARTAAPAAPALSREGQSVQERLGALNDLVLEQACPRRPRTRCGCLGVWGFGCLGVWVVGWWGVWG